MFIVNEHRENIVEKPHYQVLKKKKGWNNAFQPFFNLVTFLTFRFIDHGQTPRFMYDTAILLMAPTIAALRRVSTLGLFL